jgi:endonuclease/exonuclease/phosphatase family metal-dependent hydrolase
LDERETSSAASAPKRVGYPRLRAAIAASSWLYLLLVLAAWALIYVGDLWWPATLLLFGPRWLLLLPLLPFMLAALCWRRRSLTLLLLTLVLILGPIMGFNVPWHAVSSATPSGMRLRVLTCNMHYQRPNVSVLERLLDDSHPDIVAVQELPSHEPFDYFAEDQWHIQRMPGLFLASRYPIRRAERLGRESMKEPGSLARYEVETPVGVVTLFSLHFASPREGLYEATHHPAAGSAELDFNSALRRRQSENLVRLADEATGLVVLLGDFNTPSESAVFRAVWVRYRDAFSSSGWGWGYTFRGAKTDVRIDHILLSPGWHCERCWVGPNVGSPHLPVLADLIGTSARQ